MTLVHAPVQDHTGLGVALCNSPKFFHFRRSDSRVTLRSLPPEILRKIALCVAEARFSDVTLEGLFALKGLLGTCCWLREAVKGVVTVLRVTRLDRTGTSLTNFSVTEFAKLLKWIGGTKWLVLKCLKGEEMKSLVSKEGEGGLSSALGERLLSMNITMCVSEGWDSFFRSTGLVSLKQLHLSYMSALVIDEDFGRSIAGLGLNFLALTVLTIQEDGLRAIAQGLNLETLVLAWCLGVGNNELPILEDLHASLKTLILKGYGDVTAKGVSFLQKCTKLEMLELTAMKHFTGRLEACSIIGRKLERLQSLTLELDGFDADKCAELIAQRSGLKFLTLRFCTERAVAKIISGCAQLERVEIERSSGFNMGLLEPIIQDHRPLIDIVLI